MKKRSFLTIATGLVLVSAVVIGMTGQGIVNAEECRIVRLHGNPAEGAMGSGVDIRIEPETVLVTPGTCVIWMNWVRAAKAKVEFAEGKACQAATTAPTGFVLDAKSCYATDYIPLGGTTSLQFTEPGTYKFSVQVSGGGSPKWGSVVVSKAEM